MVVVFKGWREGLFVAEVAAVGQAHGVALASIAAVLWPDPESQAMYFVADGEGGHRFSRTWEEHQAAVREYRAVQRELQDQLFAWYDPDSNPYRVRS